MAGKPTLKQRWQYFFDNFMSKGTTAMIGGLGLVSAAIILVAALVIALGGRPLAPEGSDHVGFLEAAWMALMRTLDAGTMGGDAGWGFRLVMFLVTLGGVFVISTLIGVLTSGVESKLEELRRGRSQILEEEHTVILGWSPQIFTILAELVEANRSRQRGAVVAILADQDKVAMENAVRERIERTHNTRILCRSGNPLEIGDLEIVSPHTARAIIVLPPEGDDPDSHVIKTVLAITNNPHRREAPYHIITQLRDRRNLDVVRMIGKHDAVLPVLSREVIARIVAQTSRQSGLSAVYTELLNFGGDEIYLYADPSLAGQTFGETLARYEDSTVIGLCFADGRVQLNPPMDTRLNPGDRLVVIAADEDAIHPSGLSAPPIQAEAILPVRPPAPARPEKCLILGWNEGGITIIRELDHYVAPGSLVRVVSEMDISDEIRACCGDLANQKVEFFRASTTDRAALDGMNIAEYDHVIVLSEEHLGPQAADARTLVTLLHLRDIAERDDTPFSIVSEMLDLRNRQLAEVARVDDFVVSEHLVSLLTTQLAENPALGAVFADLFDPAGSEIYLKPITEYVKIGQPVNFYTLVEAARRRGETALGYRLLAEAGDSEKAYGVHTNPKKSERVTFAEGDRLIVLAES